MGPLIDALFGKKPKMEAIEQPKPVEKVLQGDIEKDKIMKDFAKRKRATMLNQLTTANIKVQKLGATT